jgi:hypothetical protein
MKTQLFVLSVLLTLTFLGLNQSVSAHDQELRNTNLKPRIGVMSEAVVRQKLATYGITNVTQLRLVGDSYQIRATYNNRPVDLEVQSQTGLLTEKGNLTPLPVAATAVNRVIKTYQIKLDRQQLVRPELIRPISPQ